MISLKHSTHLTKPTNLQYARDIHMLLRDVVNLNDSQGIDLYCVPSRESLIYVSQEDVVQTIPFRLTAGMLKQALQLNGYPFRWLHFDRETFKRLNPDCTFGLSIEKNGVLLGADGSFYFKLIETPTPLDNQTLVENVLASFRARALEEIEVNQQLGERDVIKEYFEYLGVSENSAKVYVTLSCEHTSIDMEKWEFTRGELKDTCMRVDLPKRRESTLSFQVEQFYCLTLGREDKARITISRDFLMAAIPDLIKS